MHTPGPWIARQRGADWVVEPKDGRLFNVGDALYHPENEANARLIAAAPEMLEMLRDALLYIEACEERDIVPSSRGDGYRQARAAIAKAEGK